MSILKRLASGYGFILLMVIFMGIYVNLKLQQSYRLTYSISSEDIRHIRLAEHLIDSLYTQARFIKKYLISGDEDYYREFEMNRDEFLNHMETLAGTIDNREGKEPFTRIREEYNLFLAGVENRTNLKQDQNSLAEQDEVVDGITAKLGRIIATSRTNVDRKLETSIRIGRRVLRFSTIAVGLTVLMGIIFSLLIAHSINRPIQILKQKTMEISTGQFAKVDLPRAPPEIRKLAQDFNTMSERLKELEVMKMDFISHVSHSLRTPLTAIREASGMLSDGTMDNAPEKQAELLYITKSECEKLIETVNRMLDLSRLEAGMMHYNLERRDLAPVIRQSILKLAPIAIRKKIDLELRPFTELPVVRLDEERIGQVMDNLLGNALKYTPEGGKVRVEVSLHGSEQDQIMVTVSDNGPGIPRKELNKIFDRFKRIDSGKETVRGTGLGLSIAKHIISNHGGKIWAESEPGSGSKFIFTLPLL